MIDKEPEQQSGHEKNQSDIVNIFQEVLLGLAKMRYKQIHSPETPVEEKNENEMFVFLFFKEYPES